MSERHFWLFDTQLARLELLSLIKPPGVSRFDYGRVISGIINGHSPDTSSTMVANRPDDGISTTNTP